MTASTRVRNRRIAGFLVAAVVAGGYVAWLPEVARTLPALAEGTTPVRGVVHVHTLQSDGTGTIAEVSAAAAQAGLNFVVVTDHGDGTRQPLPPTYENGVLIIDAVEISTAGGHVVALGMTTAPYPLGGEAADVITDVSRLGGFTVAAHPDSPNPSLRWTDWDARVDGLEWLNADSEWRDESRWSLARALLAYPARGREAVTALFDRPEETLRRWDELTKRRQVVGLAVPDAHARLGPGGLGEPYDSRFELRIPSYETMFRTMSLALPELELTMEAERDAAMVLAAIREGRFYSVIDGLGGPGAITFTARSGARTAGTGDRLPLDGPVSVRIETQVPPEALVIFFRDGVFLRRGDGSPIEEVLPAVPAVYRVEVQMPGAPGEPPIPWMVSNPIYVGRAPADVSDVEVSERSAPTVFTRLYSGNDAAGGQVERSPESAAALDIASGSSGRELLFRYALGGRPSENPYAAVVFPAGAVADYDRVLFTARADHPMRLTIQLRAPDGTGDRWRRSIYLDETPRLVTVHFDEMHPVGETASRRPSLQTIDSLLLVVDTTNTTLGSGGRVWIDDLRYGR